MTTRTGEDVKPKRGRHRRSLLVGIAVWILQSHDGLQVRKLLKALAFACFRLLSLKVLLSLKALGFV